MAHPSTPDGKLKVAVVTGDHVFDVPEFIDLFRRMNSIDFYMQDLQNYAADMSDVRKFYDVTVFYNMHGVAPDQRSSTAIERLGETKQGIFVLHHGILGFGNWHIWNAVVGIQNRKFTYHPGETVHTEIADPKHPIVAGLKPWDMLDETYKMDGVDDSSHVILRTQHPKSLSTLAWTRKYRNAPVFCYASGHGKDTYSNASFSTVVERGIQWLSEESKA
jgi:uncharacterized protein